MNDSVSMQDVKALGFYLRLVQAPESYNAKNDFQNLQHWVNIILDNFALRLRKAYPYLTPTELTICYLQRMGYSHQEMSIIMHVKEDTIRRNVYRICERLNIKSHTRKNNMDKQRAFALIVKSF